jgi:TonB family protein
MAEKTHQDDLDWNNLSNPVPLDLIDSGFEPHALPQDLPGSRSEILPRAESEAFAAAHDADSVPASLPVEPPIPETGIIQMPARGVPVPTGSGGTTFGAWPQDHAEIQDEFSRMRAKMEAETEAEKKAKLEADKEEASQRERLEQWMANARNRLLKADADLTGPSARIRIRKDHSPSLYRLAEMQKTIWVEGQATQLDSQTSSLRAQEREQAANPPLDPMATISVPTEQFLTLDAPAQPTMREQALARQAAQQAAAKQAATRPVQEAAKPQPLRPVENALTAHTAPQPPAAAPGPKNAPELQGLGETYHPMTREQALTRKVAQLRKVAEGGDNTLAIGPGELPQERSALHFAIAAVVIVAIFVLGVGLFAATQAGLFDGLENRVPFLRPNVSPRPEKPAARPIPAASAPAPSSAAPSPDVAPGNQPSAPLRAPASQARPSVRSANPGNPAATVRPTALPREPVPARSAARPTAKPVKPAKAAAVRPEPARNAAVRPVPADELPPAAPVVDADDGEIPAYAKPRAKAANLGEIILRASVQAATNIDKDNLLEMYNRYALGFPGLSGEVEIGLTVDPGGRILEGSVVSSTTGVEAFDQELLRKVLDWRLRAFPESRPKFIVVPFLFPLQGR